MTNLRAKLDAAIEKRQACQADLVDVENGLQRARAGLSKAKAELISLADARRQIEQWPALALRKGLNVDQLPDELQESAAKIEAVTKRHAQLTKASEDLEYDRQAAVRTLHAAVTEARQAAADIIGESVNERGAKLKALLDQARVLEVEVAEILHANLEGGRIHFSDDTSAGVAMAGRLGLNMLQMREVRTSHETWFRNLLVDSTAELEPVPVALAA